MPARAKDTYLDHLAVVPLFSAASRKDLQRVARASDEISVKAGRVLVEQGRLGHEFFLILEGKATVKVTRRDTLNGSIVSSFPQTFQLVKEPAGWMIADIGR